MAFSMVLDILVAGLLVVTISYAVMLNRRLRNMRQDRTELEKLATKFADSTMRAEHSIRKLKMHADELGSRMEKAQGLRDDLTFLIERGTTTADRLEETVRMARKEAPAAQPPEPERPVKRKARPEIVESEPKSDAERELFAALQSAR